LGEDALSVSRFRRRELDLNGVISIFPLFSRLYFCDRWSDFLSPISRVSTESCRWSIFLDLLFLLFPYLYSLLLTSFSSERNRGLRPRFNSLAGSFLCFYNPPVHPRENPSAFFFYFCLFPLESISFSFCVPRVTLRLLFFCTYRSLRVRNERFLVSLLFCLPFCGLIGSTFLLFSEPLCNLLHAFPLLQFPDETRYSSFFSRFFGVPISLVPFSTSDPLVHCLVGALYLHSKLYWLRQTVLSFFRIGTRTSWFPCLSTFRRRSF